MKSPEPTELFLHQDFVLALGLKCEGDTWVRPAEGYIEVVHIKRDAESIPVCLEVRAEHLKDYLCARKMALRVTSYRERVIITSTEPEFTLDSVDTQEQIDGLYALAKDLARVTADSIDGTQLQKLVSSSSKEHWGPLFAIYDLRLADAHLPKSDYGRQFQLLGIHEENPFVWQGYEMLHSCVSTIYRIAEIFEKRIE